MCVVILAVAAPVFAAQSWRVAGVDGSAQSFAMPGSGDVRPGLELTATGGGWLWVESGGALLLEISGADHPDALAQFDEFSHLAATPDGLALWSGRAKLSVDAPLESPLITPHGRISPNRGAILLIDADPRSLQLTSVKSGALLNIPGIDSAVIVPEGRSVTVPLGRPPQMSAASPAQMRRGFEPFMGMRFKNTGRPVVLDLFKPRPDAWVSGRTVEVAGRLAESDAAAQVTVDGAPATRSADGRFEAQVQMGRAGRKWIDIRAADASGRVSVLSVQVQSDGEPPQITLLGGSSSAETSDRETVIRGEVNEPALVFVNSDPAPTRNRRFEAVARLEPGENVIRILAVDPAGNRGMQTINIRRVTSALDAQVREIRLEAGRIYALIGTAADAMVAAQGRNWTADDRGTVLLDLEDRPGESAVDIEIRSPAGGKAHLRLPLGAGADWQPPQITDVVLEPQVAEVMSGFKLTARVSDAGALRPHAPGRILDADGGAAQEFRMSLAEGVYVAAVTLNRDLASGSYTVEAGPVSDANGFVSSAVQKKLLVENSAPAPVAGVTVTPTGDGVQIAFERNKEPDIDRYRVERSSARQGAYLLVAETDEPSYTDRWRPQAGVGYYYRVAAYDLSGQAGQPSEPVELSASGSAAVAVAEVTGLRLDRSTSVWRLNWDTQKAASGYNIYHLTPDGPRRMGSVLQPPYVLDRAFVSGDLRLAVSAVGGQPPIESKLSELSVNP